GTLKYRRVPGNRARKDLGRNKQRQQRSGRRSVEGSHDPENYEHSIDERDVADPYPCHLKEKRVAKGESDVADQDKPFAIKTVGDVTGWQKEEDDRQKLCQTDEAKIERASRDLVNLPTDRNRLHLQRGDQKKSSDRERCEIGVAERSQAGVVAFVIGHVLLLCHTALLNVQQFCPLTFPPASVKM